MRLNEMGIACFAASLDKPEVSRAFAEWTGAGLPILSDENGEVARAYGAFDEERGTASRWTLFIGSDGRILFVDREVSPTSHGGDILARVPLSWAGADEAWAGSALSSSEPNEGGVVDKRGENRTKSGRKRPMRGQSRHTSSGAAEERAAANKRGE